MTDHDITIRPARTEDIPGLVASSTGLLAEDAGTRDPAVNADWPRDHAAESFAAALADPARTVLAAVRGAEVVGHLAGSLTEPTAIRPVKAATLVGLYVRPEHRSAGVGARLVEEFLAWTRQQEAEHVEVAAYATNADAIRFYERQGFVPQAVTLRYPRPTSDRQPPRSAGQRKKDTLYRLEHDEDVWVATAADGGGVPYLVPLSFLWDGATLLLATPATSPTGRNLRATGRTRLGIGPTRDVVMIDGTVETLTVDELAEGEADRFAAGTGFDPRELTTPYLYFRVTPQRVQAWREADEIGGRDLMRDGKWLVAD